MQCIIEKLLQIFENTLFKIYNYNLKMRKYFIIFRCANCSKCLLIERKSIVEDGKKF